MLAFGASMPGLRLRSRRRATRGRTGGGGRKLTGSTGARRTVAASAQKLQKIN